MAYTRNPLYPAVADLECLTSIGTKLIMRIFFFNISYLSLDTFNSLYLIYQILKEKIYNYY